MHDATLNVDTWVGGPIESSDLGECAEHDRGRPFFQSHSTVCSTATESVRGCLSRCSAGARASRSTRAFHRPTEARCSIKRANFPAIFAEVPPGCPVGSKRASGCPVDDLNLAERPPESLLFIIEAELDLRTRLSASITSSSTNKGYSEHIQIFAFLLALNEYSAS